MSTDDKPCQATPSANLRQQIMDSRVPKNEREWWAQRTIERLETELAAMQARAEKAEAALTDPQQLHAHCLRTLNEGQIAHLFGERMTEIVNRAEKAEADTARMDWLEKESPEDWGIRSITRDAIDAAMKEANK